MMDKGTVKMFNKIALDNNASLQLIVGGQSINGKPLNDNTPDDVKHLSKTLNSDKEMLIYDVSVYYTNINYANYSFFVIDFDSIQGLSLTES